jgi:hypothetical protein
LRQNITSALRDQRLGRPPWCSTSERSTLRTDVSIEVLERSGEGEELEKVRRWRGEGEKRRHKGEKMVKVYCMAGG